MEKNEAENTSNEKKCIRKTKIEKDEQSNETFWSGIKKRKDLFGIILSKGTQTTDINYKEYNHRTTSQ